MAPIKDIQHNSFEGIDQPEPLSHSLSGYWSRRINDEHRIVYKVIDDNLLNSPTPLPLLMLGLIHLEFI